MTEDVTKFVIKDVTKFVIEDFPKVMTEDVTEFVTENFTNSLLPNFVIQEVPIQSCERLFLDHQLGPSCSPLYSYIEIGIIVIIRWPRCVIYDYCRDMTRYSNE